MEIWISLTKSETSNSEFGEYYPLGVRAAVSFTEREAYEDLLELFDMEVVEDEDLEKVKERVGEGMKHDGLIYSVDQQI